MEEGTEKTGMDREEIFSRAIRAGKRTYFFDVKATKGNDYYLTITESKKRFSDDGKFVYEKHKLFLYKEDFEKFMEGFNESIGYIKANSGPIEPRPEYKPENRTPNHTTDSAASSASTDTVPSKFTDVNFDDLDK